LKASPGQKTSWDGVRNYQARNLIRDAMREGDGVLFYHSQTKPPAVVALAEVAGGSYPDPTQFDTRFAPLDPDSTAAHPRWYAIDIRLVEELARPVTLPEIRATPGLENMVLLRRGRLSVQPVTPAEWKIVVALGRRSERP
jgi:predicted RNA-binding protein with PUA-like domain